MSDHDAQIIELIHRLYPITRSITGNGVRETLHAVSEIVPLEIHEVPTGTAVFDWVIPDEWNIRAAWIQNSSGKKIVDMEDSNLHVVGYSEPVRETMSLEQLRPHLYSDPDKPDWIPYRTSYYARNWGFCLSHRKLESLVEDDYTIVIDSTLEPGNLTYGELVVPGASDETCLIYTHTCHPSLGNDNLSGIAVAAMLGRWLRERSNRYTYRIVFGPGTIGSLTWLARNREQLPAIRHGLVVGLLGIGDRFVYKQSRDGEAEIDRVVRAWLNVEEPDSQVIGYSPWGYDERQFGSPGFALPVGRLTRVTEEGYPQYHTSADNLELIEPDAVAGALSALRQIVDVLEANRRYRNLAPFGEPQLGRRGIYRAIGGSASPQLQQALLWILSLSDGQHDLADIYGRSALPFDLICQSVELLTNAGLLEPAD